MKPALIALVTVVAIVDGVRTEFPPGSDLPELPEHDVKELKRMGAIQDPVDVAAADKADARATAKAQGDFEREREAIQAANASTQTNEPTGDPAVKATAAKKR
jgi:hypothetical protein